MSQIVRVLHSFVHQEDTDEQKEVSSVLTSKTFHLFFTPVSGDRARATPPTGTAAALSRSCSTRSMRASRSSERVRRGRNDLRLRVIRAADGAVEDTLTAHNECARLFSQLAQLCRDQQRSGTVPARR
jgi:hypothetical protein